MRTQVVKTSDGSSTLFVPELNEHYHSINGAVQESRHVFIHAGLNEVSCNPIRIFEMGFGTGLNAILTFLEARKRKVSIEYYALEKYPLTLEEVLAMQYPEYLKLNRKEQDVFEQIHSCVWDQKVNISKGFELTKFKASLSDFHFREEFDLVYFDAFAPEVQPVLWQREIFFRLFNCLAPGGVFVTYCAKGQVRRDLMSSGFSVERLPGPPGKREMLRGKKA